MNETGFPQTYQFPISVSLHQCIISIHLFVRDTNCQNVKFESF